MEERQTEQAWTWMRAVTGNAIPASLVVKMISDLIARLVKMSTFIYRNAAYSPTDAALLPCVWRRSPLLSTGRSIPVTRMEGAVASSSISDL